MATLDIQDQIHQKIVANCNSVCDWFDKKSAGLAFPIYSSFDVRDSGRKIAPVDANIFPAGFNNICPADKDEAVNILNNYLNKHYPAARHIALLTEEHTTNAYYWENVITLVNLLTAAGREPQICIPRQLSAPLEVKSASGQAVTVNSAVNRNGEVFVSDQKIDLVVCNNDFSDGYEEWARELRTAINPPNELGWYRRRKFSFFQQFNLLADEFAKLIDLDPALLRVETEVALEVDVDSPESREKIAAQVDKMIERLRVQYKEHGIEGEPFCFLKNNAGTYGMAVVQAHSGNEIRDWNNKIRKKMKAAKGGRDVTELVIQEGIATKFREESGGSAEPCIYTVGGELVGGFLRMHSEKGPDESLNSPGVVFKRLCMADLSDKMDECPMENVYGWIAKLGVLAIALEAKSARVKFRGYAGL